MFILHNLCDTNMAFKHITFLWSAKGVIMGTRGWYGILPGQKKKKKKPISLGQVGDTAFLHG